MRATALTKVAKVFVVENNVWACAEAFVPDLDWTPTAERSMSAVDQAVRTFLHTMLAPASTPVTPPAEA